MKIAIDAMGGDFAPREVVKGAVEAARTWKTHIILVGDRQIVQQELSQYTDHEQLPIEIVHSSQVIGMDEHPAVAVRKKKDSSIVVATQLVKERQADLVISAGSTGAQVVAALFGLGRIEGVERPTIATPLPTLTGTAVLVDSGANVDSKPYHLLQHAMMGSIYAEKIFAIPTPRVGLLNIGGEITKGNDLVVQTFDLLKKSSLNFVGNIEGRDVLTGVVDVIVCDGFVGNTMLKWSEGLAQAIFKLLKQDIKNRPWYVKMASLLLLPSLHTLQKKLDYVEYGGAPLLGVEGGCIICHGSSKAKAIVNAIRVGRDFVDTSVVAEIRQNIMTKDGDKN